MINLRFHLVSLVAVFLALGLGVTMGASFVNRATVDTLRDRVDAVENSYKDRGALLDTLSKQLQQVDGSAEALVGPQSPVLPGRLSNRPVVLVVPDGVPDGALASAEQALATADAVRPGTIRLTTAVDLEDDALVARVKERLGLKGSSRSELQGAVLAQLGDALATLSAPVAGTTGGVTRPGGPTPDLTQVAAARQQLRDLADLGLIELDTAGAPAGAALPDVVGATYLMVVSTEVDASADDAVVALAKDVVRAAPSTVTVGELAPVRDKGGVPASTTVPDASLLGNLRSDDELASRLSTVDDLEEAFGRLAVVLALQQEGTGTVGHYGNGPGATAPFPLTAR